MKPLRDQLRREVASLFAFVETVSRACVPPPQAVSYSESSSEFFRYIGLLAEQTKKHIVGFENHANDDAEEFVEARTELWTLRTAWREIHQFIKPSADADTLSQPTAMIAAMVERLRELKGFESTDFTIFHTDSFDYSQVNPNATEDAVTQLARIIDAEPFPPNLGLIGIPNSQGNALFLNCLLAHEIGEYAYAKRGIEAALAGEAASALAKHIGEEFTNKSLTLQTRLTKTVLQWAKEIFCDLFAVRLIGPCYSFAYIELFDLTNLLNKEGGLVVADDAKPPIESYRAYPSHPFRVKAQSDLLREEGWWDTIKDLDSRQCSVLRTLLELNPESFIEAEEAAAGERACFVKALLDVMPEIKKQLVRVTDGIDPGLHDYGMLWKPIAQYLTNGIVPSTLNIEDPAGNTQEVHPRPLVLLNATYRFYLEGVEALMSTIKDQDPSSAQERAAWMKRIESWTTKALEDVALLKDFKIMSATGPLGEEKKQDLVHRAPTHPIHSVLSRDTIETRRKIKISDPKSLVITPLLFRTDPYDYDSIDLRLGSYFLIPQSPPAPFLDPTEETSSKQSHRKVHKPLGSYLVIPAHQTVLGATLEFIKLPHDVSGQILTKSSVARTFLLIETAPWVHPLYRGCLTLEIANVSNTPQVLYPGFHIGQLILIANDKPADETQPLIGAYVGPIEPESPALKHPKNVLREIGVTRYRSPHFPEWLSTEK